MAAQAAHPICTIAGSPSAIIIASVAAWAAGVVATAVRADSATVAAAAFYSENGRVQGKMRARSIACEFIRALCWADPGGIWTSRFRQRRGDDGGKRRKRRPANSWTMALVGISSTFRRSPRPILAHSNDLLVLRRLNAPLSSDRAFVRTSTFLTAMFTFLVCTEFLATTAGLAAATTLRDCIMVVGMWDCEKNGMPRRGDRDVPSASQGFIQKPLSFRTSSVPAGRGTGLWMALSRHGET